MKDKLGGARTPQAPGGVTALERGLSLLVAIGQQEGGLTLSEAARSASLNKTTAFRLLQSLEAFAFVQKGGDQRYSTGPAIAVLNRASSDAGWLESVSRHHLERLAATTGETAAMFVRQGRERLCVACVHGWHPIAHSLKVGDRLPLERGASAEALLRYEQGRPEGYVAEVIISIGARVGELAAVALPVFDANGALLGALSLSGTATRYRDAAYLDSIVAHMKQLGANLNDALSIGKSVGIRSASVAKNTADHSVA